MRKFCLLPQAGGGFLSKSDDATNIIGFVQPWVVSPGLFTWPYWSPKALPEVNRWKTIVTHLFPDYDPIDCVTTFTAATTIGRYAVPLLSLVI